MKRIVVMLSVMLALGSFVWAQEAKNEVTIQGDGFFTKDSTNKGVENNPTYSGGFLAGYRYNLNHRFALEADYDYFRNSQDYPKSGGTDIKTNVSAITGAAVVKLPEFKKVRPFALAGGGGIIFDPHDAKSIETQARGSFVYGGGADVPLMKHVALRAEYRGFVYKAPDFDRSDLKTDKFTHSAVPSAGLVFTF
jgi:opacity protein-like surface antigen